MRRVRLGFTSLCVSICLAGPASAAGQATGTELRELTQRVDAIQDQLDEIQGQLQQLLALIEARAAQAGPSAPALPAELDISDAAIKGSEDAELVLVEFSDYQCPFCGRQARDTLPGLERDYIATGKVRYAFKNLPLESIHPQAFKAAEAAECARAQSKYWEMHDRLFANQQALMPADLMRYAQELGLDMVSFQRCQDGEVAARIREDLTHAAEAGVSATTPTFLGVVQPNERVKVLRKLQGAQPYAAFRSALDGLVENPTDTSGRSGGG